MDRAGQVSTPTASVSTGAAPRPGARRRPPGPEMPDAHPHTPASRRVLVSGYSNYTQPQDLLDIFTKFGNVRIDKYNSWSATLTYSNEDEVRAALSANKRLHVYGHFLSVKPYSTKSSSEDSRPPHQPPTPKREFPLSKKKGVILEPKKIDLTGDFHTQLDNILFAVRLKMEEVQSLSLLYSDLELALQAHWPGCKAIPFGSITTGLGIKTSDADCFINIPGQYRMPTGNYVNKAKRVLQQYPGTFAEILAIPRANTPIVKLYHIPTQTNCDVTFKSPLGAQNSRLLALLLHADARLLPLAVLLKYWAKAHELTGTGKLTNYALTLMLVFFLQQTPAVLPAVAWLQREPRHAYMVDHWNTGFNADPAQFPPSANTSSISELLGGFFEYYSIFNFDEMVVCPYLGFPIKREIFKDTATVPKEFDLYKNNVLNNYVMPMRYQTAMVVQDPFEQCHNVASTITSKLALDIKTYFKFCANAYEKEKTNACQDFLKIILLQKPKLIRGKTHPEYRVNLFPRIVNTIISFDWKSVVRDMVMEIFENMLKIKLGKVEEKVNPDTKKEKEKYSGAITKPIWKRKSFSRLYNQMDLTLEERQGRITQEVINVEKQDVNVQFQLTMTYCHEPKSAVISIRLGSGDLDAFREFGKFFISVTQNWVTELLKPFSMPNCKDTATKIAETLEANNHTSEIDSDDDEEEIVLLPKSHRTTKPNGPDATDTTSSTAVSSPQSRSRAQSAMEILTDRTKNCLIIKADPQSNEPLKNNSNETTPSSTTEVVSNNTDNPSIKGADKFLPNSTENSTINTENCDKKDVTLTKNVENFFKNAESLVTSEAGASNKATPAPVATSSDVSIACALK
ncbi:uncharacterized protein LOC111356507 [Spodoptera litura]|uniref:Uncharacterized protein LOC111356507 n=1 Tax=Spodoptera litura TaxID=69820 RepID=A0A9J7ITI9_SPOLT|nr:uncharacterized protein LOC111356507 [Spodoptera litura]